jgi:hypothetical protein
VISDLLHEASQVRPRLRRVVEATTSNPVGLTRRGFRPYRSALTRSSTISEMSRLLRRRSKKDAPPEGSTVLEDEPSDVDDASQSSSTERGDDEPERRKSALRPRLPSAESSGKQNPACDDNPASTTGEDNPSSSPQKLLQATQPRTSLAQRIANFGKAHKPRGGKEGAADINETPALTGAGSSPTGVIDLVPDGKAEDMSSANPSSNNNTNNKALIRDRIARHLLQRRNPHNANNDRHNNSNIDTSNKKVSIGHASTTATTQGEEDNLMEEEDDDEEGNEEGVDEEADPARARWASPTSRTKRNSHSHGQASSPSSASRSEATKARRPPMLSPPSLVDVTSPEAPLSDASTSRRGSSRSSNNNPRGRKDGSRASPSSHKGKSNPEPSPHPAQPRPSLVKDLAPPSMADLHMSSGSVSDGDDEGAMMNRSYASGDDEAAAPIASPRRGRRKAVQVDLGASGSSVVASSDDAPTTTTRASAMDRYFAKVQELRSRSRSRSRSCSREPSSRMGGARSVMGLPTTGSAPPSRTVSGSAIPAVRRRGSGSGTCSVAGASSIGLGRNHSLGSSLSLRSRSDNYDDTQSVLPEMLRPSSSSTPTRSVVTESPIASPATRRNRSKTPTRLLTKSPRRATTKAATRVDGTPKGTHDASDAASLVGMVDTRIATTMDQPSRRYESDAQASPLAVKRGDVEAAPAFCRRASHSSAVSHAAASDVLVEAALLVTPKRKPRRTVSPRSSPSRPSSAAAPKTPDPIPRTTLSSGKTAGVQGGTEAESTPRRTPSRHSTVGDRDLEEMYGPRKVSRRVGRPGGTTEEDHGDDGAGIDPTTPDYQRPVLFKSPAPKTPTPEEALNMSGSRMLQRSNSTDSSSPGSAVSDPAVERILKMLDDISPTKKSTNGTASPGTPTSVEGMQTPGSSKSVRRSRRIKINASLLSDDEETIVSKETLDAALNAGKSGRIDRLKKEMLDEVLAAKGKSVSVQKSPNSRRIIVKTLVGPDIAAASPRNGHEVMKEHALKAASLFAKELVSPQRPSAMERAKSQRIVDENSRDVPTPVRKAKSSRNVTNDVFGTSADRDQQRSADVTKVSSSISPKTPSRSTHERSSRSNHERKVKSSRTPRAGEPDAGQVARQESQHGESPRKSPKGSKSLTNRHTLPTRTASSESNRSEREARPQKSPSSPTSRSATNAKGADSSHDKRSTPKRNVSGQSATSKDSASLHKSRSTRKARVDGGTQSEVDAKLEASTSSLSRKSTSHRSVARSTRPRHDDDPIAVNPVEGKKVMKLLRYQSDSSLASNDLSESSPKAGSFAQLQIPGIDCHQQTMAVQFEDC